MLRLGKAFPNMRTQIYRLGRFSASIIAVAAAFLLAAGSAHAEVTHIVAGPFAFPGVKQGSSISFTVTVTAQQIGDNEAAWPTGQIDILQNGQPYATIYPTLGMSDASPDISWSSSGGAVTLDGSTTTPSGWSGSPGAYITGAGSMIFELDNLPAGDYTVQSWEEVNVGGLRGIASTRFYVDTIPATPTVTPIKQDKLIVIFQSTPTTATVGTAFNVAALGYSSDGSLKAVTITRSSDGNTVASAGAGDNSTSTASGSDTIPVAGSVTYTATVTDTEGTIPVTATFTVTATAAPANPLVVTISGPSSAPVSK
jgi:hypothetical protein